MKNTQETGGFAQKRMNSFHIYFGNGLGISTIFGAMTYSSNRNVDFSYPNTGETPMEAEKVEIMLLGKIPEKATNAINKILSRKNSSDSVNGPYANVAIGEWLSVANILAAEALLTEKLGESVRIE